jgi:hypothetical protein
MASTGISCLTARGMGSPVRSRIVSRDLHKLAALRLLADRMSELKIQQQRRIECGDNPAEVERETAQKEAP